MSMIKFLVTVLFLFLNAEETLQEECGVQFQSKLRELLNIKQNCSTAFYENCCQIQQLVTKSPSGVYQVRYTEPSPFNPHTSSYVEAQCDMETDGGGWLVIQRRLPNGTVNFTRDWNDYENGFGDISGEFWYGLKNIHTLTTQTPSVELRIDMVRESDGFEFFWTYQTFIVAGAYNKYKLTIGGASRTYGTDAMAYHNGHLFSTYDKDNDRNGGNCAILDQAGWWYNACYHANLNGPHNTPTSNPAISTGFARLIWNDGSTFEDLSSAEMKIRPKSCVLSQDSPCIK